jgi:hypothetical protein
LLQVFICLRPPPPLTYCIRIYALSILIHTGKGGRGGELPRVKARAATVTKAVENTNMTYCISSL